MQNNYQRSFETQTETHTHTWMYGRTDAKRRVSSSFAVDKYFASNYIGNEDKSGWPRDWPIFVRIDTLLQNQYQMARFKSCILRSVLCIAIGYTIIWNRPRIFNIKRYTYIYQYVFSNQAEQQLKESFAKEIYKLYEQKNINCTRLFQNDTIELHKARSYHQKHKKRPHLEKVYIRAAQNCTYFKVSRSYVNFTFSEEEESFPIAYSIMLYTDIEQAERLLRVIYRPQNYYCIHVDVKAKKKFRLAVEMISRCFENVFISSKSIDVQWGYFSTFTPDIVCMEDLLKYKKWKYFINLTGQEFPLKTNADLVKILKAFNGSNNSEGTIKRRNTYRTDYICEGKEPTNIRKKDPLPPGIRRENLVKGSKLITVTRGYVEYLVRNPVSLAFREWLNNTGNPDETYPATLNHLPHLGVPGSYKGEPETDPETYPYITRYVHWLDPYGDPNWETSCIGGNYVRQICIISVGHLPILKTKKELFVNKFHLTYDPLALDCMEQYIWYRAANQMLGYDELDTTYYANLSFVKNHV